MRSIFFALAATVSVFAHNLQFYGEDLQDQFVYEHYFQNKTDGIFLDIGAHGGIKNNNTYFFEKHLNWKGICFEPTPAVFAELRRNRACMCIQAAVSTKPGTTSFVINGCSYLNGVLDQFDPRQFKKHRYANRLKRGCSKLITVKCVTLNDVLEEQNITDIDFISLDTEGGELAILQSIDYNRFNIDVICVENIYLDDEMRSFLALKGYKLVAHIHRDDFYKKI